MLLKYIYFECGLCLNYSMGGFINSVFLFAAIAAVPFGGVKDSGYGRIHGAEGLLEYTYARSVVKTRFKIPLRFTTFKRTKFSEKVLTLLIKKLHGRKK